MSMYEALDKYKGKDINVIMAGSGGTTPGKLISLGSEWFVMETRWSCKQWFDLAQLQSFWANEDAPVE